MGTDSKPERKLRWTTTLRLQEVYTDEAGYENTDDKLVVYGDGETAEAAHRDAISGIGAGLATSDEVKIETEPHAP